MTKGWNPAGGGSTITLPLLYVTAAVTESPPVYCFSAVMRRVTSVTSQVAVAPAVQAPEVGFPPSLPETVILTWLLATDRPSGAVTAFASALIRYPAGHTRRTWPGRR